MRKQIAFDIETSKETPEDAIDWNHHRPLGISCIASIQSDSKEPEVWYSVDSNNKPAPRMNRTDLAAFVEYLATRAQQDFTILTWNGLSFDFDVLAEESGLEEECQQLAMEHTDMMFHIVCEKGFPVGLEAAASGLKLSGKLAGVTGMEVPKLWANGQHCKVIEYVKQDARVTLEIAEKAAEQKKFQWRTRKGAISTMDLEKGWLSVRDALKLPLPDTSWMTHPMPRESFFNWIPAH